MPCSHSSGVRRNALIRSPLPIHLSIKVSAALGTGSVECGPEPHDLQSCYTDLYAC